jgi:prophage endopeptidase
MIAALALRGVVPGLLVAGVAAGCAYAGYAHGVATTRTRYELRIGSDALKHARAVLAWEARLKAIERQRVDAMAALSTTYEKAREDEKEQYERHAAELRNGLVRVRRRFACGAPADSADAADVAAGASASRADAAEGVGLHLADAQFLLRIASEADQVADQLRACQAVLRADRGQP